MKKKQNRLEDLKEMLISWRSGDLHKAGIYWAYIETEKDGFTRGYRAALTNVIQKIEDDNH